MKKFLLILITLNVNVHLFGQTYTYHPFPVDTGYWGYRYYDDFHNATNTFSEYILAGDTTISGIDYKKIRLNQAWTSPSYGAIREDNKVVYFYPDTASQEYVLYDFNLIAGDTILHPYGGAVCLNDTVIINYIDTISLSDGLHLQWHLSDFVTWIDGVGSSFYLLNPANVLCVSGNDQLEYMESDSVQVIYFPPPPPPPNCLAFYYTAYDSVMNTFNLSIPSPVGGTIASLQWDFGDGSTSTSYYANHFYPIDSIYNVCLNVVSHSGATCSYCHLIGKDSAGNIIRNGGFSLNANATGLKDLHSDKAILKINPNPNNGEVTLELTQPLNNLRIKVLNITGQVISDRNNMSGKLFGLDISDQPNGVYFIEVSNEQTILRSKLIKN